MIKGAMLLSESNGKPKRSYEDIKMIASINNGVLRMVRNKITNKIRAMRIIKRDIVEYKEDESLFMKELALLRTLDHPNIVKLYEFFKEERYYYLLSEYCEGGELFKLVKANNKGFNEFL